MSTTPFLPTGSNFKDVSVKPVTATDRDRTRDTRDGRTDESSFLKSIRKDQSETNRAEGDAGVETPDSHAVRKPRDAETRPDQGVTTTTPIDLNELSEPQIECEICTEIEPHSEQNTPPETPVVFVPANDTAAIPTGQDIPGENQQPTKTPDTDSNPDVQESGNAANDHPPVGLILIPGDSLIPIPEDPPRLTLILNDGQSNLPSDDLARLISVAPVVKSPVGSEQQIDSEDSDENNITVLEEIADIDSELAVIIPFVEPVDSQQSSNENANAIVPVIESNTTINSADEETVETNREQLNTQSIAANLPEQSAEKRMTAEVEEVGAETAEGHAYSENPPINTASTVIPAVTETAASPVVTDPVHAENVKSVQQADETQKSETKVKLAETTTSESPHITRSVAVEKNTTVRPSEIPPQVTKLVDQVTSAMNKAVASGQVLKIRLHPPELGVLQVELVQTENGLSARLETDTLSTQKLLKEHMAVLKETLQQQGHSIEKIDVQMQQRSASDDQQKQQASQFADQDAQRERQRSQHSERETRHRASESSNEDNSLVTTSTTLDSDELNIHV